MTTTANSLLFDVRFPQLLLDQMGRGEMTVPMLLVMLYLHKWADWKTGQVAHASAGGVRTATARAFSVRAFQVAMKKLEKMGWITRHTVTGSHQDYSVTLHNYKWADEGGNVHILNRKPLVVPRRALRKHNNRPLDSATSRDHATEACAEDREREPLHVEERALSGALNNGVERDENADTCDGLAREACAEKCTEGSDKILCDPSLISSAAAHASENKMAAPPKGKFSDFPETFTPSDANRALASKLGLDIKESRDAFEDWNISHRGRSADWHRSFNSWLRYERKLSRQEKKQVPMFDALKAFEESR